MNKLNFRLYKSALHINHLLPIFSKIIILFIVSCELRNTVTLSTDIIGLFIYPNNNILIYKKTNTSKTDDINFRYNFNMYRRKYYQYSKF